MIRLRQVVRELVMKKAEVIEREFESVLSDAQLQLFADIAEQAIEELKRPGAYTADGLSFDANGVGVDLWSAESVCCDALGWILRVAAIKQHDYHERRTLSILASNHVGRRVYECTGRSIIGINDDSGCAAAIKALQQAGNPFGMSLKNGDTRSCPIRSL